MKKKSVLCPYCNQRAVLRPASFIYGQSPTSAGRHLYVCGNWPKCDAYVSAHSFDLSPMGTLANGELRNQRILAHRALERYRKVTGMNKQEVYLWLGTKLDLHMDDTHVAKFSIEQCQKVLALCQNPQKPRNQRERAG